VYTQTIAQGCTSLSHNTTRGAQIVAVMRAYPESPTVEDHIIYAHALADLGVHVEVIHKFGEKLPYDLRTDEMRDADAAAGETRKGWYLATTDTSRLTHYILEAVRRTGGLPNLGMHLGPSRMIAVDNDWEGDTIEWHTAADDRGEPQTVTVLTPGALNPHGTWRHWGGSHIYYTIPDHVDVSTLREVQETGVPADEPRDGWVVKTGFGLGVMLPPSVRREGHYRLYRQAQIIDAPATLLKLITKPEPVIRDFDDDDEDVIEFRESVEDALKAVPWSEALEGVAYPDGVETCGCEIWTRHGGSRKSMVAHTDCSHFDGRTFLTVHSDNVPNHDILRELAKGRGGKGYSKWEALAAFRFDGDMSAVAREYGFSRPSEPRNHNWTAVFGDTEDGPVFGMSGVAQPFGMTTPDPDRCPHGGRPEACVPCLDSQLTASKTNRGAQ